MTAGPRGNSPYTDDSSYMPLALVIAGFLVYSTVLLARMSLVVQGQRYWTLADDQMISMRLRGAPGARRGPHVEC